MQQNIPLMGGISQKPTIHKEIYQKLFIYENSIYLILNSNYITISWKVFSDQPVDNAL